MLKIVVACANGAGSSLMIKFKVQEVMKELGIKAQIHHCAISEAKSMASRYDVVITALNFVKMFDSVKEKGVTVLGIKNVLSAKEIKEKLMESGVCGNSLLLDNGYGNDGGQFKKVARAC